MFSMVQKYYWLGLSILLQKKHDVSTLKRVEVQFAPISTGEGGKSALEKQQLLENERRERKKVVMSVEG